MDEATLNQIRAAAPRDSTWLSANAGSGKTKVLIDRVARLLLHDTPPQRILCLTYTRAAASEMQNRLFQRLGGWAMLPDAELRAELARLGEETGDASILPRARRLFARAIETPGGLKIQTIHAFCSSLLRRFPLEAAVPPDFAEADERSLGQLRLEVLDRFSRGSEAEAMRALMRQLDEASFDALLVEIGKYRDAFEGKVPDFHTLFDLPAGLTTQGVAAKVFTGSEVALFARLVPLLRQGGANDNKLADRLAAAAPGDLAALETALLTQSGAAVPYAARTGKHVTKASQTRIDPLDLAALDALGQRVEAARGQRLGLEALAMAEALHRFARLWLPAMDAAKAARGWLDFDDLIRLARRLLGSSSVAQWVLFKLDGGIDHILIDEAQDTSPAQWQVIDLLTQEFTAGQGARDERRTIFVVGDRKQSIYSFQGADLTGFEAAQGRFSRRLSDIGQGMAQMQLLHSFRSSDAILRLVDQCFGTKSGGLGGAPQHIAFFPALAGRVDLWPGLPAIGKPEETPWDSPLDRPSPDHPDILLARTIAAELRAMIDRGDRIETRDGPRALHEGDVLILVQRRNLLFESLIRACKAQGLAIAGADRLQLADELAVQDLIALLRFLALPEDDLSLAVALRSPLFGLTEDALFRLAHGRRGYLWEALRTDPVYAQTRAILDDLRAQVDFLRPYELVERILTRHDGRRRIRARFGAEVGEAVEAFVDLALAYEAEHVPSLDGFLGWLLASEAEVKRQSDKAGRQIRVMTVHGAKGLESPLVILPDTALRSAPRGSVIGLAEGVPILRSPRERATPAQQAADAQVVAAREAEADRLLYVALTRAERWLIVCGAGSVEDPASWFGRVEGAMRDLGAVALATPTGVGMRLAHGTWPTAQPASADAPMPAVGVTLPDLPTEGESRLPLSPSALGGAKALAGEGDEPEAAMARGSLIHRLLEELPRTADPEALGAALVQGQPGGAEALSEVRALLADPALHEVLCGEALVEVGLSGLWCGHRMFGTIDRLIVDDRRVLAIDFKSNRTVPTDPGQVPEGLLRQMGAYAHLLRGIYPGREVQCALLWTATGTLMRLDAAQMQAALDRAALDPAVGAP